MAYYVFSGGGTSGHVNPALAIMQELLIRVPDSKISYFGRKNSIEEILFLKLKDKLVNDFNINKSNLNFVPIEAAAFPFRPGLKMVKAWINYKKSLKYCKSFFINNRPDVVIGTGGYVSAPVLAAAHKLKIDVLLHEQNAVMGRANKLLAKKAKWICLTSEAAAKDLQVGDQQQIIVTGNPLRREYLERIISNNIFAESEQKIAIIDKKQQNTEDNIDEILISSSFQPGLHKLKESFTILVVGGSLGARQLNKTLFELFTTKNRNDDVRSDQYKEEKKLFFVLSAGIRLYEECLKITENIERKFISDNIDDGFLIEQSIDVENYKLNMSCLVKPYLHNLYEYMYNADFLICRAGAGILSELMCLGKTALFVPYPYAAMNHQWYNAKEIVDKGAAFICKDEKFTSTYLIKFLNDLMIENDNSLLTLKAEKIKKMAKLDASKIIVDLLLKGETF